jgi:predicted ATPase
MNPHRRDAGFSGPHGSLIKVRAMFSSHGETMRDVLRFTPLKPGDCFLLDEPDAGHDIAWVLKIRKGLDMLVKNGCQIITTSHHPVFWDAENMIELKRGYMDQALAKLRESLY